MIISYVNQRNDAIFIIPYFYHFYYPISAHSTIKRKFVIIIQYDVAQIKGLAA